MLKSVIAVFIGMAVAIVGVEAGARMLANMLGISSYMKYHERIGWTAEPGATKRHKNTHLGFDVTYQVNNKGLRGTAYDEQKPAGIYRIMVLGDSNGFGWGIAEGKHLAAIIDNEMKDVQVVNLSLSGYGTDQQYLRFVEEGVAYKPDLVIVQVTPNDFEEIQHPFFNQKPKPQFLLDEEGRLNLVNVPVRPVGVKCQDFYDNSLPLPFKDWLDWHSYAYNYFNEKYYALKRKTSKSQSAELSREVFSATSVVLFKKIILELKNKLDEIGAKGLIVHASKDLSENDYLHDSSLPVLDLYQKLSGYARDNSVELYYKDAIHWNEKGHRLVAEELMKAIEEYRGPATSSR